MHMGIGISIPHPAPKGTIIVETKTFYPDEMQALVFHVKPFYPGSL